MRQKANRNQFQKQSQRLLSILAAFILAFSCVIVGFTFDTAFAASADYPAVLTRISVYDNSRNLNITGTADKSAVNTWPTNGGMNENWRFDLVGTDRTGSYYQIVNHGTGRLLTPMLFSGDEGTDIVIYGKTNEKVQCWYVLPVSQDKYGNDLCYTHLSSAGTWKIAQLLS